MSFTELQSIVYGTAPTHGVQRDLGLFEATLRTQLDAKVGAALQNGDLLSASIIDRVRSDHMDARIIMLLSWVSLFATAFVVSRPGRSMWPLYALMPLTFMVSVRYARLTKRASMYAANPLEIDILNQRLGL